jgi:hypothetical protein
MIWISKLVPSRKDYLPQPNSYTCQSAAIGMITGGDIMTIRKDLECDGEPGNPYVMGEYLKPRVKEYKFNDCASLMDARRAIDDGYQLIIHSWLSRSGHVVKISGYEADPKTLSYRFVVDDPWSEFDGASFSYPNPDLSGNDVRYSSYLMYATCVVGQSYEDARQVYRRGELDSNKPGAWLHCLKT